MTRLFLSVPAIAALSTLSACFMEVHDKGPDAPPDYDVEVPTDLTTEIPDRQWDRRCGQEACKEVDIMVVYGLNESISAQSTVVVEAFDNPRFAGSPLASARVTGFDASHLGSSTHASLYLAPGDFFVRAYLSTDEEVVAPYEYGNMELVSNKPVGYHGAASGPQSIHVDADAPSGTPFTVTLAHLFKAPQDELPSDANLRIRLHVNPESVTVNERLLIELRDTTDFAVTPVATYFIPSDSLLVEGKKGQGEFIARNLAPGKYSILAYLDSNNNGFADDEEIQQTFRKEGAPDFVRIVERRTETIDLTLE